MRPRPVVASIGGSILGEVAERTAFVRNLAATLRAVSRSRRLLATTGGGSVARAYIAAGRGLGIREEGLDEIGIAATRLNAALLAHTLGRSAHPGVPATVPEAVAASRRFRIVVMGGTAPGWTTDTVAVRLAIASKASHLVNATAVDGVYTADPRKDPAARRLEHVTFRELVRLSGKGHTKAGPNVVFDPVAARLAARHRIPVFVVDGRDLRNLAAAIADRPFRGTRVGP